MKVQIYDKDSNQCRPNVKNRAVFDRRKFEIAFFGGQTEAYLHGDIIKSVGRPFICDIVREWYQESSLAVVSHYRAHTNLLLPSEDTPYGRQHPTRTEGLVGKIMEKYEELKAQ